MRRYGVAQLSLDELELEYLLELVERSLSANGPLLGIEVQGQLAEALKIAQGDNDGTV